MRKFNTKIEHAPKVFAMLEDVMCVLNRDHNNNTQILYKINKVIEKAEWPPEDQTIWSVIEEMYSTLKEAYEYMKNDIYSPKSDPRLWECIENTYEVLVLAKPDSG